MWGGLLDCVGVGGFKGEGRGEKREEWVRGEK